MSDDNDQSKEGREDSETTALTGVLEDEPFSLTPSDRGGEQDQGLLETDDRQAAEIREIFGTTFPQYLQPVEEIVEQILAGKADTESFGALAGMLSSLMSAASRMGFDDVHRALVQLNEHLATLDGRSSESFSKEEREAVLGDLLELKDLAEQMAGNDSAAETERQETVFAALKDKPGIGDLVLRRLSAAGLVTVDQLRMGRPEEIAAVTGLDIAIVHNLLDALSDSTVGETPARASEAGTMGTLPHDVGERPAESTSSTSQGQPAVSIPVAVESLHEEVLQKLRAEVEMEASIEELRAQIRSLRSRVSERRSRLSSLASSTSEKRETLRSLSTRTADKTIIVEELRARRDELARQCASFDEALRQAEVRLEVLKQERRNLEMRTMDLGREVLGLVDTLGQMRRAIAKGSREE